MADREIIVRLRAEINQYKQDMAAAGQAGAQAADKTESAWSKSTSGLGKMAKVVDKNSQALSSVGTAAIATGAAMTALTVGALKSGVQFNTLKQTSMAAMTTLTGSTAKANVQMDRLNAFGDNNWIMRDVLIRAQQQMVGFGISTEKVIPYMDALSEAVAATGGSSQDFEELARVMAKVKSEGKITAVTLREFGIRGVDAATIIGEAMGKTADDIRNEITAGTLDADTALDALADGMKDKFDGASDNVRNTFKGAIDNVLAGLRDLSAEFAKPIVDPDGGGLGVQGLNIFADALGGARKAAENLSDPVKVALAAVGGLGGAGLAAGGTFLVLAPRIVSTMEAVQQLRTALPRTSSAIGKVGKAASVAAAAFTVLAAASAIANTFSDTVKSATEMENSLRQLRNETGVSKDALDDFIHTTGSGGAEITGFGQALESVDMNGFMKTLDWMGGGFGFLDNDVRLANEAIDNFDQTLSSFANSGDWDELNDSFQAAVDSASDYGYEAEDLIEKMPGLKSVLIDQAEAMGESTDTATLAKIALGEIKPSADDAAEGIDDLGDASDETGESLDDLIDKFNELSGIFIGSEEAQIAYRQRLDDIKDSIDENGATLDNNTQAGRDNREQLIGLAEDGLALVEANARLGESQETLQGNLQDTYDDLVTTAKQMGMNSDDAKDYARDLLGIPDDVPTDVYIEEVAKAIADAGSIDEAIQDIRDKTVDVTLKWYEDKSHLSDLQKQYPGARIPSPNYSTGGSVAAPKQRKPKYYGGIDVMGMAAGGVMSTAQFVKPGDIRFAGDRSDVDEAWIPLDGSARSIDILKEAIARMPGFGEGMAEGGTTGTTDVGAIPTPDTTPMTDVWQTMFDQMLDITTTGWTTQRGIQAKTLDAMVDKLTTTSATQVNVQQAALATMLGRLESNLGQQRNVHSNAHASMTAKQQMELSRQLKQLQDGFSSQHRSMSSTLSTMSKVLAGQWASMSSTQSARLSEMRSNADTGFSLIRSGGTDQMSQLARAVAQEMGTIPPETRTAMKDTAKVLNDFGAAANKAFGDLGVNVPTLAYKDGGVTPGWSPGRDIHDFYSPTAGRLRLSGGESFMVPEFTQLVGGEQGVNRINQLAKRGRLFTEFDNSQAFASGGVWRNLWAINKKEFPESRLTSAVRNSTTVSGNRSMHAVGKAIDVAGPRPMDTAYMGKMFNFWAQNYGKNLAELIHSPAGNRQIKNGQNYLYGGAVRTQHFDHVHIAAHKALTEAMAGAGAMPGFGGFEPSHPFLDRAKVKPGADLEKSYRKAAKKITGGLQSNYSKKLSDHLFGNQLGKGIMSQLSTGLVKEAAKYGKEQTFVDPGGSGVERWRDTVIQALKRVGLPTTPDYVNGWLSQIKTESGGNPSIRQGVHDVNSGGNEAMGLVQVIPGTFAAFRDKTLPNDRTHPLANLVAGMNWANFKYGDRMLSVIGHGHGYADGTSKARRGWNTVGEDGWEIVGQNGPEARWFDGGETVLPHQQAKRALNADSLITATKPQQITPEALAAAVQSGGINSEDLAKAIDGMKLTFQADGQQFTGAVHAAVGAGYDQSRSRLSKSSQKIGAR